MTNVDISQLHENFRITMSEELRVALIVIWEDPAIQRVFGVFFKGFSIISVQP